MATSPGGERSGRGPQTRPVDKGKAVQEEAIPERVEPIMIVLPSPPRPPVAPPPSLVKRKKRKRSPEEPRTGRPPSGYPNA